MRPDDLGELAVLPTSSPRDAGCIEVLVTACGPGGCRWARVLPARSLIGQEGCSRALELPAHEELAVGPQTDKGFGPLVVMTCDSVLAGHEGQARF